MARPAQMLWDIVHVLGEAEGLPLTTENIAEALGKKNSQVTFVLHQHKGLFVRHPAQKGISLCGRVSLTKEGMRWAADLPAMIQDLEDQMHARRAAKWARSMAARNEPMPLPTKMIRVLSIFSEDRICPYL